MPVPRDAFTVYSEALCRHVDTYIDDTRVYRVQDLTYCQNDRGFKLLLNPFMVRTHSPIFDPILPSQIIFGTPRENSRHDAKSGFAPRRFCSVCVKCSASRYSADEVAPDAFPSDSEYQTCWIFDSVADQTS